MCFLICIRLENEQRVRAGTVPMKQCWPGAELWHVPVVPPVPLRLQIEKVGAPKQRSLRQGFPSSLVLRPASKYCMLTP